MTLDPELENEISKIKPGSLHGGRAAGALRTTMSEETTLGSPLTAAPPPKETPSMPRARDISPGEAPKRLI
jgi:hypothetical protein